ncbi:MAG: zinc-dependent alcohol dehydrogenase family protein [Dehalococcoidia bacterium]|nr:MAG: zinc-dependent alcohol dehydrogenase family protein [Dehalococcoidia bacterium]
MKAWVLQKQAAIETKPLLLQELPIPKVEDNKIRVKVHACGVCRTDLHVAEGDLPLRKSPLILGHQIVGVVGEVGRGVTKFKVGDRASIAWLNSACGNCKFCRSGRENLCSEAKFTGWSVDGGYAEYVTVSQDFAFHLGENLSFVEAAPLMCPGITGYRALKLTEAKRGDRLGLYGFGPAASYVIQVAKYLGIETYAITRSQKNKDWARRLGVDWVGGYEDEIPTKFDTAIVFPPAGNLVELALSQLDSGGKLVLAAVYMTPIEVKNYNHLWMERSVKSMANITREDGKEFLEIAAKVGIKTEVEVFPFDKLPDVLILAKGGKVKGNPVIKVAD